MFLFEPREKGLAENQDQRNVRAAPWNTQLSQQVTPAGLTEAGIWWAWEEGTCRRTPTYKGPFPKVCKFKSEFSHHAFVSLISALQLFKWQLIQVEVGTYQGTRPGCRWPWIPRCTHTCNSPRCSHNGRSHRAQVWSDIHSHLHFWKFMTKVHD